MFGQSEWGVSKDRWEVAGGIEASSRVIVTYAPKGSHMEPGFDENEIRAAERALALSLIHI